MSEIPKLPGYTTYVVHCGTKVTFAMKPTRKKGPLQVLNPLGVWVNATELNVGKPVGSSPKGYASAKGRE